MTVTLALHWYYLPLAMLLCAGIWFALAWRSTSGMFPGLGELMLAWVCVGAAALITLGHYL